jgi:hypothetical protein
MCVCVVCDCVCVIACVCVHMCVRDIQVSFVSEILRDAAINYMYVIFLFFDSCVINVVFFYFCGI